MKTNLTKIKQSLCCNKCFAVQKKYEGKAAVHLLLLHQPVVFVKVGL